LETAEIAGCEATSYKPTGGRPSSLKQKGKSWYGELDRRFLN